MNDQPEERDQPPEPDVCLIEPEETQPVVKVTDQQGGAKRDSFFKKRDYE